MATISEVFVTNSGYLKISDICKGFVDTFSDLPTEDVQAKDVYSVLDEDGKYYIYNGTAWDPVGGSFFLGGGSDKQIQELENRIKDLEDIVNTFDINGGSPS